MELLFIGTQEITILMMGGLLIFLPLAWIIICLIDIAKRDFANKQTDQLLLILLIIFAPFLGGLIYFIVLRNNYPKKVKASTI